MPASGPDDSEFDSRRVSGPKAGHRKGDSARAERLEAALRENLKRRKAAARAREAAADGDDEGAAADGRGEV